MLMRSESSAGKVQGKARQFIRQGYKGQGKLNHRMYYLDRKILKFYTILEARMIRKSPTSLHDMFMKNAHKLS